MSKSLEIILKGFESINLEALGENSLIDRFDTKFIFNLKMLPDMLKKLDKQYSVLEIWGKRLMTYKNRYFDTEDYQFYRDHHNGKKRRSKIRLRQYVDSDTNFLEIKHKSNTGRMRKVRQKVDDFDNRLSSSSEDFIRRRISNELPLQQTLQNRFERFTLVHQEHQERITFDINLKFTHNGRHKDFENLVVAEIKQPKINRSTMMFRILRDQNITPYRISKYCIGLTSVNPHLKYNAFKEKIRKIEKITAN